jgi:predicted GIY-YIG superfamily endonuclease
MVYIEEQPDQSSAMKREIAIKRLRHTAKGKLIASQPQK